MSCSIEFGVLQDWSTISLIPEFRVDLCEEEFSKLTPMLTLVSARTGIEFDLYSGASLEGDEIKVFFEEASAAHAESSQSEAKIFKQLIATASQAIRLGKPLQYRGL